jgi:hypothetical protein
VWPEKIPNNQYRILPNRQSEDSGYCLIAIVQDGSDLYAAISNILTRELFVEKVYKPSNLNSFFCIGDLVKIEDDNEWKSILIYLTKMRVLE